jgi:hypothetical protein
MRSKNDGLWYVSQPSRLGGIGCEDYREQVLKELIARGYDVIHPFNAFPYEHFEGNSAVGRDMAMKYCCDLLDMCDGRLIVTGISEGVLIEINYVLKNYENPRIKVFSNYDPQWSNMRQKFSSQDRFKNTLLFLE